MRRGLSVFLPLTGTCYLLQITDQMYVGSCIQTEADIQTLANVAVSKFESLIDSNITLFHFSSFYLWVF